jgi:hypothetical protein
MGSHFSSDSHYGVLVRQDTGTPPWAFMRVLVVGAGNPLVEFAGFQRRPVERAFAVRFKPKADFGDASSAKSFPLDLL